MNLLRLPYRALQRIAVFEITKMLCASTAKLADRSTRPEVVELDRETLEHYLGRGDAPGCEPIVSRLNRANQPDGGATRCFGVVADGRLLAFSWFKVGSVEPELNFGYHPGTATAVRLPETAAFVFHVYTAREARGRGWMSCLLRHAAHTMREENGVASFVTTTEIINRPALSMFRNLGFRSLGDYWRYGVGGWARGWYPKPAAPVLALG